MVAQWDQLAQPGLVGWAAMLAVAVSILTSVYLLYERHAKFLPQLAALKADLIAKSAQTLVLMQDARQKYNAAVDEFTDSAKMLRDALEGPSSASDAVDSARERCCVLLSTSINLNINFVELEELYFSYDKSRLESFICNELCEDITIFSDRLRVMNHPNLLARIDSDRSPMLLRRRTVRPWFKIIESLPEDRRLLAHERVSAKVEELLSHSGRESD
jgi:hypothetical protein